MRHALCCAPPSSWSFRRGRSSPLPTRNAGQNELQCVNAPVAGQARRETTDGHPPPPIAPFKVSFIVLSAHRASGAGAVCQRSPHWPQVLSIVARMPSRVVARAARFRNTAKSNAPTHPRQCQLNYAHDPESEALLWPRSDADDSPALSPSMRLAPFPWTAGGALTTPNGRESASGSCPLAPAAWCCRSSADGSAPPASWSSCARITFSAAASCHMASAAHSTGGNREPAPWSGRRAVGNVNGASSEQSSDQASHGDCSAMPSPWMLWAQACQTAARSLGGRLDDRRCSASRTKRVASRRRCGAWATTQAASTSKHCPSARG